MSKKFSLLVIAFLMFLSIFSMPVDAKSKEVNPQEVDAEQMINDLAKYVSAKNNRIKIKDVPTEIYNKYGSENIKEMIKGINKLNRDAEQGKVKISDNLTIQDTNDTAYYIQGGVNKIVSYWWGKAKYMSTSKASEFAYLMGNVKYSAVAGGILYGAMSMGVGAAVGGLTALYFEALSDSVKYHNSLTKKGVIVNLTWAAVYSVKTQ